MNFSELILPKFLWFDTKNNERRCIEFFFARRQIVVCFEARITDLGPVSRKSRNFSGVNRVTQFSLYLQNEGVLRHETLQLFLFLFPLQHIKRPALQNKQVPVLRMVFGPEKFWGLSRNGPLIRSSDNSFFVRKTKHCKMLKCYFFALRKNSCFTQFLCQVVIV